MGNRWIAVKEESSYAAKPTWVSGVKYYPVTEYTPTPNNNTMELKESINLMAAGGILGGFVGEGRLNMYARPDNIPFFLKWLWGATTPSGGPVYKHTFTVADGVKSFSMEYCHGYPATNSIVAVGNVVKRIELVAAQNRPCMANITTQYNTEDTSAAASTLGSVPGLRPYTLFDATVVSFSETLKCENISITMERTIPDDAHTSGSRFLPDISEEAFAITGEFDARFQSLTQRKKFFGGAGSSDAPQNDFLTGALTCNFLGQLSGGSPSNYSMNITCPAIAITEIESGTVNRERLRQRLRFQAYSYTSGGGAAANTIELWNNVATLA
jgi:hypothetical protein